MRSRITFLKCNRWNKHRRTTMTTPQDRELAERIARIYRDGEHLAERAVADLLAAHREAGVQAEIARINSAIREMNSFVFSTPLRNPVDAARNEG